MLWYYMQSSDFAASRRSCCRYQIICLSVTRNPLPADYRRQVLIWLSDSFHRGSRRILVPDLPPKIFDLRYHARLRLRPPGRPVIPAVTIPLVRRSLAFLGDDLPPSADIGLKASPTICACVLAVASPALAMLSPESLVILARFEPSATSDRRQHSRRRCSARLCLRCLVCALAIGAEDAVLDIERGAAGDGRSRSAADAIRRCITGLAPTSSTRCCCPGVRGLASAITVRR